MSPRCRSCSPLPRDVQATASLLERRWTLATIYACASGASRFNEFRQSLPGISPTTLSERLEQLEAAGIVERHLIPGRPPHTEYQLTLRGEKLARAGDIIVANVDLTLAQDSTGPLAIKVLQEMGITRVKDASKILLFLDHSYPAPDVKVANLHAMMRDFAFKHGAHLTEGSISHQHTLEDHVTPGMLLLGADV